MDAKLDIALRHPSSLSATTRVIIRRRAEKSSPVRERIAAFGGPLIEYHPGIGAVTAELPTAVIARMASDSDVLGVSSDARIGANQLLTGLTSTVSGTTTTLTSTTDSLLSSYDTQALRRTLGVQQNFTRGGVKVTTPSDGYGHGTHIAGLIAGNGNNSSGKYVGVALGARLIGMKVLDSYGRGYTSDVIKALEFAATNKAALRIDVINLSLGHPILEPAATDPLVQAVERAVAAGIVVVVSAGNNGRNPSTGEIGYAGINSPANAPSALTVGSLRTRATADRRDDEVSPFSSRGPTWYDGSLKPDVVAPGHALIATQSVSSLLYSNLLLRSDPGYVRLSGTSMAAGVASGVVALIIEANRKDEGTTSVVTPNTVKAILQYTAIPVADPDPRTSAEFEQGAGGINAAGAIALTRATEPTMPFGTQWLETSVSPVTSIAGVNHSWAKRIVWRDHVVWGDTLKFRLTAWATHIVWGDHIVWGEHFVWADGFFSDVNAVWQSFSTWSTHIVWGEAFEHIVWGENDAHIVYGDSTTVVDAAAVDSSF